MQEDARIYVRETARYESNMSYNVVKEEVRYYVRENLR
jgi:hypothetical protein